VTPNWSPKPPSSSAVRAAACTGRGRSSTQRNRRASTGPACSGAVGRRVADSRDTTTMTPVNDAASARNTAVSPLIAMITPASPGPAILARPVIVA